MTVDLTSRVWFDVVLGNHKLSLGALQGWMLVEEGRGCMLKNEADDLLQLTAFPPRVLATGLRKLVGEIAKEESKQAGIKVYAVHPHTSGGSSGFHYFAEDTHYTHAAVPPGEYRYFVRGISDVAGVVVNFSLLSNNENIVDILESAINVIGTIRVKPSEGKEETNIFVRESDGTLEFICNAVGSAQGVMELELLPNKERLESLRWYWEEYLDAPFGPYATRAHAVLEDLPRLRRELFDALFISTESRELLERSGQGLIRLVFQSKNPVLQSLPWELLWSVVPEPGVPRFSVSRRFDEAQSESIQSSNRILFVIARAAEGRDIRYHSTVLPIVGYIASRRFAVEVEILRPATLERIVEVVDGARKAGRPFHIIHFDGHGEIDSRRGGRLYFEGPDGEVDFEAFGNAVAHTPIVVLNACRSGVFPDNGASLAETLLHNGVSTVVAMQGNVRADAARCFTEAFYSGVLDGQTVAGAVDQGRFALIGNRERVTDNGIFSLDDWGIPVLFGDGSALLKLDSERAEQEEANTRWTWNDEFFGRDRELHEMERAYRNGKVMVLHGAAGMGKTALLRQFLAWICLTTRGAERPAITEILDPQWHDQTKFSEQFLQGLKNSSEGEVPVKTLFVIDDEKGIGTGESQIMALVMLSAVAAAVEMPVIVTCPTAPKGLHKLVAAISVDPLQESAFYAAHLVATSRNSTAGELPMWARTALLSVVAKHPQSVRMVFKQSQRFPAAPEQLTGKAATIWARETCTEILGRSSEAELLVKNLDDTDRALAMRLRHFVRFVDGRLLQRYDQLSSAPVADWPSALNRWCELGLLVEVEPAVFWMHPLFYFWILAKENLDSSTTSKEERKAFLRACADMTTLSRKAIASQEPYETNEALSLLRFNKRTLAELTLEAVAGDEYEIANAIVRGLVMFAFQSSSSFEFLLACEAQAAELRECASEISAGAADYMIFVAFEVAKQVADAGDFDGAEQAYDTLLNWTQHFNHQSSELLAIVHHELGLIARQRMNYPLAEKYLLKALEYDAKTTNKRPVPERCELASLYADRGDFDEARQQLRLAKEELSPEDDTGRAHIHSRLGRFAVVEKNLDTAEEEYYEAKRLFPEGSMDRAKAEYELAFIAIQQKRPGPARRLLKKLIRNPHLDKGGIYIELARAELLLGSGLDAIRCAQEALNNFQQTRNFLGVARAYFLIGHLAHLYGMQNEARKAFSIAQMLPIHLDPKLQSELQAEVAALEAQKVPEEGCPSGSERC